MKYLSYKKQSGHVNGTLVAIILLCMGLAMLAGLAVWLYVQYNDQKSNVDSKIEAAVAKAERDTRAEDETRFLEREKEPFASFAGPEDYGSLSFKYPKTWSVYEDSDVSVGGDYMAYLNPGVVPPVKGKSQRFALRVAIEGKEYGDVIASYESKIEKGDLKSRTVSANGQRGTRLDGSFSKDIRGAVVIFKVRDKTISMFTDADTFKDDFDKLIKTIEFKI